MAKTPTSNMHVFIDGQNLYKSAKDAFGFDLPNFDVFALSGQLAKQQNCVLSGVNFYTGVPSLSEKPAWHHYWMKKLSAMGRKGATIFSPPLRYQKQTEVDRNGHVRTVNIGREKGVDVRLALDIVRHAMDSKINAIMIVSRDNDLHEAVQDVLKMAEQQGRCIRLFSAYPTSSYTPHHRGIRGTQPVPIDQAFYEKCLDPVDYFPTQEALQNHGAINPISVMPPIEPRKPSDSSAVCAARALKYLEMAAVHNQRAQSPGCRP